MNKEKELKLSGTILFNQYLSKYDLTMMFVVFFILDYIFLFALNRYKGSSTLDALVFADNNKILVIVSLIVISFVLLELFKLRNKAYFTKNIKDKIHIYTINNEYIKLEVDDTITEINWNEISTIVNYKMYFKIHLKNNKSKHIIIPKNFFINDTDMVKFISFIKKHSSIKYSSIIFK